MEKKILIAGFFFYLRYVNATVFKFYVAFIKQSVDKFFQQVKKSLASKSSVLTECFYKLL